jgi:hypothetical protein
VNIADTYPMIRHGEYKIFSDIEYIFKYLKNSFSIVKEDLFDPIVKDNYERIMKYHKTLLKPNCDLLISYCLKNKVDEETKKKEVQRLEQKLKNMENMLSESKSEYFSGTD